mmetsp:Transcript_39018/g.107459  ORF Transcript_39018/g.107459 Transcript_39018/m.107459 type:complete len:279 (-) Transcript_39018:839-1675(-)
MTARAPSPELLSSPGPLQGPSAKLEPSSLSAALFPRVPGAALEASRLGAGVPTRVRSSKIMNSLMFLHAGAVLGPSRSWAVVLACTPSPEPAMPPNLSQGPGVALAPSNPWAVMPSSWALSPKPVPTLPWAPGAATKLPCSRPATSGRASTHKPRNSRMVKQAPSAFSARDASLKTSSQHSARKHRAALCEGSWGTSTNKTCFRASGSETSPLTIESPRCLEAPLRSRSLQHISKKPWRRSRRCGCCWSGMGAERSRVSTFACCRNTMARRTHANEDG